ncbi:tRNA(Ile)-lysidine synthase [Sphingobium sp. B11D3B]|uniref:tRNA lysidine(34) synthetase TilS n=1 Tax=Sphingobium sp. B11D3B TaxID=2940575 RepID=UPI0022271489|nr:tRNA lysidine(34) synthetase TilS [Sphingobium sp. B11D3B]MCW2387901.1 tRNA(Ile)-lysidine synthase [Sphingobium sp. B11D3B]
MADTLAQRLPEAVQHLLGRALQASERIGIAVSGGADSMALLALAARCWPGHVEAATVDHRLRADSAAEAAMVARWCENEGVPHAILTVAQPLEGNLQAAARAARYALLEDWQQVRGLDWLMTAHQADDQLETLVLRLNRGAGVAGLLAIRGRRGTLLRPLLNERRADLRAWCQRENVPFIDDPSNENQRFDRVRVRQALTGCDLIDPGGMNRALEALGEAEDAIAWMLDRLAAEHLVLAGDRADLTRTDLPPELLRRLILRMVAHLNPQAEKPRGPSLDQALVQLFDGKTVTLADCLVTGGARWTMRRAPPRRSC